MKNIVISIRNSQKGRFWRIINRKAMERGERRAKVRRAESELKKSESAKCEERASRPCCVFTNKRSSADRFPSV